MPAGRNKKPEQTSDQLDALRRQVRELTEANQKLKAESGQDSRLIHALEQELVHLRATMENADNFGVFRLLLEHDSELGVPREVAYASPSMNRILAITDAGQHANWFENMHPDDFQVIHQAQQKGRETHQLDATVRIYHPDKNEWRWIRAVSRGGYEQDGSIRYINGIMLDVTKYKRLESRLLDYQERLRSLTGEIMAAEERERRRIAGILHDKIGQCLFAVKWGLEQLLEGTGCGLSGSNEIVDMLDESIEQTRSLTWELHPRELHEFGLPTALRRLGKDFQARSGLKVNMSVASPNLELDAELATLLYRVVSELLNNIAKHARAKSAFIDLKTEERFLLLSVSDDGVGFAPLSQTPTQSYGFGLLSVHERLLGAGGEMKIFPRPGGGTRVNLRTPLQSQAGIV